MAVVGAWVCHIQSPTISHIVSSTCRDHHQQAESGLRDNDTQQIQQGRSIRAFIFLDICCCFDRLERKCMTSSLRHHHSLLWEAIMFTYGGGSILAWTLTWRLDWARTQDLSNLMNLVLSAAHLLKVNWWSTFGKGGSTLEGGGRVGTAPLEKQQTKESDRVESRRVHTQSSDIGSVDQ